MANVSVYKCSPSLLADKYTQLNSALFSLNGGTGYVLQPEVMRSDIFDPLQEKNRVKYIMDVRVGLHLFAYLSIYPCHRCSITDLSAFIFCRLSLPDTFPSRAAASPALLWRWSSADARMRSLRRLSIVRNAQMWLNGKLLNLRDLRSISHR